jgi:hypothetical protein
MTKSRETIRLRESLCRHSHIALAIVSAATMACAPEVGGAGEEEHVEVERSELTPGQIDSIRVQAVLVSNDDGSLAPTITPQQIRADLNTASQAFGPASVRFDFDPQTDVSRVNSTLLGRECTLAAGAVLGTATEPSCDFPIHNDERNRVAQTYPGKMVIYFSASERTRRDAAGLWQYGPRTFNWSNQVDWFVTMTGGDPGDNLSHEMGHYLHLPHTHWNLFGSSNEAANAIRNYVGGGPKERGYELFDGDGLVSTPPDPGAGLFSANGLDTCNVNMGTLDLPVTFPDNSTFTYRFTPDRENVMSYWDQRCLNKVPRIAGDQIGVVRNAIDVDNRTQLLDLRQQYSAVFEPGNNQETRAIGWGFSDFVTRFNQEIASGKHLVHMQAYDLGGGQVRWDGAWDTGARGTTAALGWALGDFAPRFDQEIAAGRHLVHMQAYDLGGGQIRWDGVWEDGSRGTTRALGWALYDFATRFNQEIAAGRHLVHMQAYDLGGGQIRWDGVWEAGSTGTTRAIGWALSDFVPRFNQEITAGKHLVHMQAYDLGGGQIRYDGVWENGSRGTTLGTALLFNDFVLRNEQELGAGRRLVHFQPYDVGNGQIRYDGVWETPAVTQTHVFAETIYKFAEQFNQQLAAGNHLVLMHSVRGR